MIYDFIFGSLPPKMHDSYVVPLQIDLIPSSAVCWLAGGFRAGEKVDAFPTVLIPNPCFCFSCWVLLCNQSCPLVTDLKTFFSFLKRDTDFPHVGVM